MRPVIDSIRARLASLGVATYFIDVPEAPKYPYVLLWTGAGVPHDEVLGAGADLRDRLGVTMVAALPEAVLEIVPLVRGLLDGFTPDSGSWLMSELRLFDSQDVQADRDVTIPVTGRYAYFAVDLYRLNGQPR